MAAVDILLPTCNRLASLALTLSGVLGQQPRECRLIVADQGEPAANETPTIASLARLIRLHGIDVEWHHRRARHGIAEQRDFLLRQASAAAVLYLDDDVYLEPWVMARLYQVLREQACGFVGAFPAGLSFLDDVRPAQQVVEFWNGPVTAEAIMPGEPVWARHHLHRAANVYHAAQQLPAGAQRLYKVAWIASCILYDRAKLLEVGGFSFWPRLPRFHSGEEVLVQNLLMRRWGGCAILPSGAYHTEEPSTVLNAEGTVDGHALELLPEMLGGDARRALG